MKKMKKRFFIIYTVVAIVVISVFAIRLFRKSSVSGVEMQTASVDTTSETELVIESEMTSETNSVVDISEVAAETESQNFTEVETEVTFSEDIADATVWEKVTPQIVWGNLDFWYTKKEQSYDAGTDSFQFSSKLTPIVHFIGVPNAAALDTNATATVTVLLNGNPCTFTLDGSMQQCIMYGVKPEDTFIDIEIKCQIPSNVIISVTGEEITE